MALGSFEYVLLFTLTLILIGGKSLLGAFLLNRVIENTKKRGNFEIDFVFGIFILVLCFAVSRILYTYFDFFLTRFDYNKYHLIPNQYVWKAASVVFLSGLAILMFIIDKKVINFKFKGVFAYIIIAVIIFELIYPISSADDFELIAMVETIGALIGVILFPMIFIYLGIKTPRLRKISLIFAFGIIIFAIGAGIQARFVIIPLMEIYGAIMKSIVWIISISMKLIGLTMITYSCTKFY
ncbi:MAG: hypothetical protein GF383_02670 [Candidatus Lokiarchaeota archaeon]|nr:hypothetical protein [Candidatus Lokiarchaeota archaeon]MBD3338336.1 hypothetical protein [Candidatus Lokiarchaeota archaeon]